eukprot:884512-Amphidinium_carterae.1
MGMGSGGLGGGGVLLNASDSLKVRASTPMKASTIQKIDGTPHVHYYFEARRQACLHVRAPRACSAMDFRRLLCSTVGTNNADSVTYEPVLHILRRRHLVATCGCSSRLGLRPHDAANELVCMQQLQATWMQDRARSRTYTMGSCTTKRS